MKTTTLPPFSPTGTTDMKFLAGKKKRYLILFILSLTLSFISAIGIVAFGLMAIYPAAAVCCIISAALLCASPFFYNSFKKTKLLIKIKLILNDGKNYFEKFEEILEIKRYYIEGLILQTKKQGLFSNVEIHEDGIFVK